MSGLNVEDGEEEELEVTPKCLCWAPGHWSPLYDKGGEGVRGVNQGLVL